MTTARETDTSGDFAQVGPAEDEGAPKAHANGHVKHANGTAKRPSRAPSVQKTEATGPGTVSTEFEADSETAYARAKKQAEADLAASQEKVNRLRKLLSLPVVPWPTVDVAELAAPVLLPPIRRVRARKAAAAPKAKKGAAGKRAGKSGPRGPRANSLPSRVLAHLVAHPWSLTKAIADTLNVKATAVSQALNGLKNSGKAKSKGPRREMRWAAV